MYDQLETYRMIEPALRERLKSSIRLVLELYNRTETKILAYWLQGWKRLLGDALKPMAHCEVIQLLKVD